MIYEKTVGDSSQHSETVLEDQDELKCQMAMSLTIMLPVANLANAKLSQNMNNNWNPGKLVLIWENFVRGIQLIPTWQGLYGFLRCVCPCSLDKVALALEELTSGIV